MLALWSSGSKTIRASLRSSCSRIWATLSLSVQSLPSLLALQHLSSLLLDSRGRRLFAFVIEQSHRCRNGDPAPAGGAGVEFFHPALQMVETPDQPLDFAQTAIEALDEPSRFVQVAIDRGPT